MCFGGVSCCFFCADSDNGDHYGVTTKSKEALIPTETAESAELHDTSKKNTQLSLSDPQSAFIQTKGAVYQI